MEEVLVGWWKYFLCQSRKLWNFVLTGYYQMEIDRAKKELAVVNATIKSRPRSLSHLSSSVSRKVTLQDRAKAYQRKLEQIKRGLNAEQKSEA